MKCLNCQEETSNPKFCSRSCAAKYNNVHYPKRKPANSCIDCGEPIRSDTKRCKKCDTESRKIYHTIGDLPRKDSGKFSPVRYHARKEYENTHGSQSCIICGYDKHIEICHIKPIYSFSDDTPISDVNSVSNLIGLCPNCHWELDNDYIVLC